MNLTSCTRYEYIVLLLSKRKKQNVTSASVFKTCSSHWNAVFSPSDPNDKWHFRCKDLLPHSSSSTQGWGLHQSKSPVQSARPDSTQLDSTEIAQFSEFWTFSELIELSWVESGALNTPKTDKNWLWPSLQLLTNSSLRRLGISRVITYIIIVNMAEWRKKALGLIFIAYNMGQIIKSVCVCQTVSVSVCEHSHGRISWSIFTKIDADVRTPKVKTSLLGVTVAPLFPLFCPQKPPF